MASSPRRPLRIVVLSVTLLAGLALAVPRARAAWPITPGTTDPIAPASVAPRVPVSVVDGSGGAFLAWQDARNGNWSVYAQHVLAGGATDPAWPASGAAVCTFPTGNHTAPRLIADGTGGVIVAWTDSRAGTNNTDVYAQRLTATGLVAPGWTVDGVAVAATAIAEQAPALCTDGAGGAIVVWEYVFASNDHDIYAAHVSAAGIVAPWGGVWTPVSNSLEPAIAPDSSGGCYIAFTDNAGPSLIQIRATHLGPTGSSIYPPTVLSGFAPYIQIDPRMVVDGAGGAFVAWSDQISGDYDVYITRIGPTSAPEQPFYGNAVRVVAVAGSDQMLSGLAYDGAGGALVTWNDGRYGPTPQAYAQRILGTAFVAPGWPTNGVALGYTGSYENNPTPVPDGTGGGLFVWRDERGGPFGGSLYATRLAADGSLAPHWASGGNILVATSQQAPDFAVCPDARRGALAVVADFHTTQLALSLYAARVDRYGALGEAGPSFVSLQDVPADQGGRVRMVWNASYLDADPVFPIGSYWIWRQTPATTALRAVRDGAHWADESAGEPAVAPSPGRWFRRAGDAAATYAWEYVTSLPAVGSAQYSYVAATLGDSMPGRDPLTYFLVEAHDRNSPAFWDSAPDSSHSVDNLPPGMPVPFTGAYAAGATHLHWGRNTEPDLAGYRLYRGASAGFVPGPGSLVAAVPDTGYADPGAAGAYYKLAAVDLHGNESPYAVLAPGGTLAAPREAPLAFALEGPRPNPGRGDRLSVGFTLPTAAPARLELLDVSGRRVAAIEVGTLGAGRHALDLAAGARLAPGLYLVRLSRGGEARTARVVVLE